jgi:hypothetical protein
MWQAPPGAVEGIRKDVAVSHHLPVVPGIQAVRGPEHTVRSIEYTFARLQRRVELDCVPCFSVHLCRGMQEPRVLASLGDG